MPKATQLTQIEQERIITLREEGYSMRQISERVKRSLCAISNAINRKIHKKRTGRRPLNSSRMIRALAREAVRSKGATARNLANKVGAKGTKQTICSMLKTQIALKCYKPVAISQLTKKHKINRVNWAKTFHKIDFSKEVIWSDEKRFCLRGPDGYYKAWLHSKEENTICSLPRCSSVHIWAGIYQDQIIGPYILPKNQTFNAKTYVYSYFQYLYLSNFL